MLGLSERYEWGVVLSKLHLLSKPSFTEQLFEELGCNLYGHQTFSLSANGNFHITSLSSKKEEVGEDVGSIPESLADILGRKDADGKAPKGVKYELWKACHHSCLDMAAEPQKEAEVRMHIDTTLLAITTFLRSHGISFSGPALVLEPSNGASDYRIGSLPLCLEAKRKGALRPFFQMVFVNRPICKLFAPC